MKKVVLTFNIIQAESIAPFLDNGLPYLHYHYFLQKLEGGFTWLWIEEKTDYQWLEEKIKEGLIYIFE